MGEPAGIAGEITLKAWLRRGENLPPFVYLGDLADLQRQAAALQLAVPIERAQDAKDALRLFTAALPVLSFPLSAPRAWGLPDSEHAGAILASIEQAVVMAMAGTAAAMVTNPIHKHSLARAGFAFRGHTEFLAELTGVRQAVMLLQAQDLRVVLVTVHQSLRGAIAELTPEKICAVARLTHRDLQRRFGIETPRLALAALNPHAGEGGLMGDEEARILAPALSELRREGIGIEGPIPADTLFTAARRKSYDCAICHYHDQGLIPIKTLDVFGGVNVTLGLPLVRTSPDHGTALDIAGKGVADAGSLMAALRLAAELSRHGR